MLEITSTALNDVKLLKPRRFADSRGFFVETWNAQRMAQNGLDLSFVQDNLSLSREVGTLRGLHYQSPPHAQGKLVGCLAGAVLDVAVDVRRGSPTYGHWVAEELSFENGCQLWIPEGFLHGFVTLLPDTVIAYKCTGHYNPQADGNVLWNSCGIDWALGGQSPKLSDKDIAATAFADWVSPFEYKG